MADKNYFEKVFTSKRGEVYKVIEYLGDRYYKVIFENDETIKSRIDHILSGNVKNHKTKTVFGTGYLGGDYYTPLNSKLVYSRWKDMLRRCYDEKTQEKQPTYKGITVCEEWHNFQGFAEWWMHNWKSWMDDNWQLDKDIRVKDSKIYSPITCSLVPKEVNTLIMVNRNQRNSYYIGVQKIGNRFLSAFTKYGKCVKIGIFDTELEAFNAYKNAKEIYIKEIIEKWKGKIVEDIYNILYNYQVKVTD